MSQLSSTFSCSGIVFPLFLHVPNPCTDDVDVPFKAELPRVPYLSTLCSFEFLHDLLPLQEEASLANLKNNNKKTHLS